MSRRQVVLASVAAAAASALLAAACDDAEEARPVRVAFTVRAPETLSQLSAVVSYPSALEPVSTVSGLACAPSHGFRNVFFFENDPGSFEVELVGDDFLAVQRLPSVATRPSDVASDGQIDSRADGDDAGNLADAEQIAGHLGTGPGDASAVAGDGGNSDQDGDGCRDGSSDDDEDGEADDDSAGDIPDDNRYRTSDTQPLRSAVVMTRRMFACSFLATESVAANDFHVRVSDAYGGGQTITSAVELFVEEIVSHGSTTTSSTSTTFAESETSLHEIVVGVTVDAGLLGALQFDLTARQGSGGFVGAAASARCRALVPNALSTFNDRGNGTLSAAVVALDGIETPGDVVVCRFRAVEAVTLDDFDVEVVDSAGVEGEKPPRCPTMAATALRVVD